MKKLDFTIGLIFLIVLTVIVYNVFGFEITLIYLIIDMSVGISYQFAKLNKSHEKDIPDHPGFIFTIPKESKEDSIVLLESSTLHSNAMINDIEQYFSLKIGIKVVVLNKPFKVKGILTQEDYQKTLKEVEKENNEG